MPAIKKIYAEYDRSEFDVIGIARDEREWLLKFVADNDMPWPQISQSRAHEEEMEILESYRVTGVPAYFLVDPEGKIVDPSLGIRPPELESTLSDLLKN